MHFKTIVLKKHVYKQSSLRIKMSTVKVFIFRHGQSTFNRANRFTGFHDAPLTATGKDDAKILAERLKDKKIGIAFETSLKRSKNTLKEVLRYHKNANIYIDDRMIERNYGKLTGKTHWQVVKTHGIKNYDAWHRGFSARPPKGESFSDVEKRVSSFIEDIRKIAKKEKKNIAISAHGNSIRLFRKIMEGASEDEAVQWQIPYDNYFEYSVAV